MSALELMRLNTGSFKSSSHNFESICGAKSRVAINTHNLCWSLSLNGFRATTAKNAQGSRIAIPHIPAHLRAYVGPRGAAPYEVGASLIYGDVRHPGECIEMDPISLQTVTLDGSDVDGEEVQDFKEDEEASTAFRPSVDGGSFSSTTTTATPTQDKLLFRVRVHLENRETAAHVYLPSEEGEPRVIDTNWARNGSLHMQGVGRIGKGSYNVTVEVRSVNGYEFQWKSKFGSISLVLN